MSDSSDPLAFKAPKLIVRNSRIQGQGVYAGQRIRPGRRIVEYTGEVIPSEEADRRHDDDAMDRHHTFLFEVSNGTTIDATQIGSLARYINHSCDPNCEAVEEDDRIFIEAIKNIQPGAELCYDYAYNHDGPLTPKLRRQYKCECGTARCRGTILKPTRSK